MLRARRGFTLTEVLVVVLIVAILAAIIYPSFGGSREEARQTVCISNLRQIYAAVAAYNADHDGSPALAALPVGPGNLAPYAKSSEIYFCPDFPRAFRAIQIGSCYNWNFISGITDDPRIPEEDRRLGNGQTRQQMAEYERKGSNYPLIICLWHDEMFYYPAEKKYDDRLKGAFVLELRENGSVWRGRIRYPRGVTTKIWQQMLDVQNGRDPDRR